MDESGKDLIFATGAPGSRWSGSLRCISRNIAVDMSDEEEQESFELEVYDENGNIKSRAQHFGAYWGPYHKYGHKFDRIDTLSKDEILHEILKPFKRKDGVKVIKSHWFSYHLDFLVETFPRAKIITFYLPDKICFEWWKAVGGFDIHYPIYTWYENEERIIDKIREENSHIVSFFARKKRFLERYFDIFELFSDLDLPLEFKKIDLSKLKEFSSEKAELTVDDPRYYRIECNKISKKLTTIYNPNVINDDMFIYDMLNKEVPKGLSNFDLHDYEKIKKVNAQ